jgi:hypothetical protein
VRNEQVSTFYASGLAVHVKETESTGVKYLNSGEDKGKIVTSACGYTATVLCT